MGVLLGGSFLVAALAVRSNHAFAWKNYWNQPIAGEPRPNPYGDTPAPKTFTHVSPLDPQIFSSIHEHAADDLLVYQSMQRGSPEMYPVAGDYDFFQQDHFDAPGYPKLHFIEHQYAGDWTNWWAPNAACSAAMLRSAGFEILERPEDEVFICRRTPASSGPGAVYPARSQGRGGSNGKANGHTSESGGT